MPDNLLQSAIESSLPSDVSAESSPAQIDVKPESSQAAPVETTTQKVEQEVPFHEHPRWKERQAEIDLLRKQNQALLELAQKSQVSFQQQPADPYAGMDDETRRFWEGVDKRVEAVAAKKIAEKEQVFMREIAQTREAQAAIAYERFQQQHPDVKPGSPEENMIADKFRQGHSLDDSYKIVMFDKRTREAEEKARQAQTQKQQQRQAASTEQPSNIPPKSPIQPNANLKGRAAIEDFVNRHMRGEVV